MLVSHVEDSVYVGDNFEISVTDFHFHPLIMGFNRSRVVKTTGSVRKLSVVYKDLAICLRKMFNKINMDFYFNRSWW